jgi:hypothetical protein
MELTRHCIKRICEIQPPSTLAEQMPTEKFVVQVIDWTVYSEAEMKKNLKARMLLSDGVSKMTCLVIDKAFNALVSETLPVICNTEIQHQEL